MKRVGRWATPRRTNKQVGAPRDVSRQYELEAQRQLLGTSGAAGPCKRIDPHTGLVIEIIAPSSPLPRRKSHD